MGLLQQLIFTQELILRFLSGIWNVGFCGGKKNREPREKPLEQGREPTTNSTHLWRLLREPNLDHSGGRRLLSPLRYFCHATDLIWEVAKQQGTTGHGKYRSTCVVSNYFIGK